MLFLLNNWKLITAGIGVLAIVGFGLYVWHRIDKAGYDRCEAKYEQAAQEHNDKSAVKIKKAEKHYETVNTKILRDKSPNNPVGPRIQLAIDSLQNPEPDR